MYKNKSILFLTLHLRTIEKETKAAAMLPYNQRNASTERTAVVHVCALQQGYVMKIPKKKKEKKERREHCVINPPGVPKTSTAALGNSTARRHVPT